MKLGVFGCIVAALPLIQKVSHQGWAREKRYPNIGRIKLSSRKGQVADAVFYIQQGKEAVVAILGTRSVFRRRLNGHPLRVATTSAIDECVVTRLEKASRAK